MEALTFTTDSIMDAKNEAIITGNQYSSSSAANKDSSTNSISEAQEEMKLAAEQPNTDPSTSVARPVDLYKAIFSDDSDDDGDDELNFSSAVEPEKTSKGANTTLNRLIAGDFLESLGKELGLEVPEAPSFLDKANSTRLTSSTHAKPAPALETEIHLNDKEARIHESRIPETAGAGSPSKAYNSRAGTASIFSGDYRRDADKKEQKHSRKHRKRSRNRRSGSETDSSSGRGYHDYSKSEKKASESKREHIKRVERHEKRKKSVSRSQYSSDESDSELEDDGRKNGKSGDRRRHSGGSKSGGGRKHC